MIRADTGVLKQTTYLDANSTTTDYVLTFLNKVLLGVTSPVTITDTAVFEISRSDKLPS